MRLDQPKHYRIRLTGDTLKSYSSACKTKKYGSSNITLAILNIGRFISFPNRRKTRNATLRHKYRENFELYFNYGRVSPPAIKLSGHTTSISYQGKRTCTIKRKSIMGGNHEINDRSWKP